MSALKRVALTLFIKRPRPILSCRRAAHSTISFYAMIIFEYLGVGGSPIKILLHQHLVTNTVPFLAIQLPFKQHEKQKRVWRCLNNAVLTTNIPNTIKRHIGHTIKGLSYLSAT